MVEDGMFVTCGPGEGRMGMKLRESCESHDSHYLVASTLGIKLDTFLLINFVDNFIRVYNAPWLLSPITFFSLLPVPINPLLVPTTSFPQIVTLGFVL